MCIRDRCVGEDDRVYDPVTAAQAADMLLQMDGIDASFVTVSYTHLL